MHLHVALASRLLFFLFVSLGQSGKVVIRALVPVLVDDDAHYTRWQMRNRDRTGQRCCPIRSVLLLATVNWARTNYMMRAFRGELIVVHGARHVHKVVQFWL